jgi:hypothetical protein
MRRLAAALLAVALAFVPAAWAMRSVYNGDTSVTTSNSAVSFTDNGSGGTSATFRARYVRVYSLPSSANTCFVDFKDTTATSADTALGPGDWVEKSYTEADAIVGVGAICGTGTATFRIHAHR